MTELTKLESEITTLEVGKTYVFKDEACKEKYLSVCTANENYYEEYYDNGFTIEEVDSYQDGMIKGSTIISKEYPSEYHLFKLKEDETPSSETIAENKYTTEQLLEALTKHKNVSASIKLNEIHRILAGDLTFLQDAIINGDAILFKGEYGTSTHDFTDDASNYTVRLPYETITHLGVEIPKPLSKHPRYNSTYYYRSIDGKLTHNSWGNMEVDQDIFKYGIWTDKQQAEVAVEKINSVLLINM